MNQISFPFRHHIKYVYFLDVYSLIEPVLVDRRDFLKSESMYAIHDLSFSNLVYS